MRCRRFGICPRHSRGGSKRSMAPRASGARLSAGRVRKDAGLSAGGRGYRWRHRRFRRLGLVSIHTAEYSARRVGSPKRERWPSKRWPWVKSWRTFRSTLYASHYLGLACHALGDYRRAPGVAGRHAVAGTEWQPARSADGDRVLGGFQAITLAWLARCLAELRGVRRERRRGPPGGGARGRARQPVQPGRGLHRPGLQLPRQGDLDAARPVLERACSVAREANLALFRPQAIRLLGGAYLLAGRIDEGLALVQAAAEEVESKRLLMQQAAVLALLGEACLFAGRVDEASMPPSARWPSPGSEGSVGMRPPRYTCSARPPRAAPSNRQGRAPLPGGDRTGGRAGDASPARAQPPGDRPPVRPRRRP